jgi:hypothetical protein
VIRACDGKVETHVFNELIKDVEVIDETLKNLSLHVGGIHIPEVVQQEVADDSSKYQEFERMLVTMEEQFEKTRESLSQRINDINKFMDMIKEDLDKNLEEQGKQLMKNLSKCNICELRIDALEKRPKEFHPVASINAPKEVDTEHKDAIRAIRDLEAKINAIKAGKNFTTYIAIDLLSQISNIEYKSLPTKADKSYLEEIENGLKDKVKELERKLQKLRIEFQNLTKLYGNITKEVKKETSDERDEVSLSTKQLMGFKCANCERDLVNLEGTQADFFNWKKLPRQQNKKKINMNLHNIGHGFSKMLQTMSTDNLKSRDLYNRSLVEEEDNEESSLPSIKRDFLSDNEQEVKRFMSPTTSKIKLK